MISIRKRLQLGLILVIGFFILQMGIFYVSGSAIEGDITATVQKNTQISSKLSTLASEVQKIRRYEKEYFIYVSNIERRTGYISDWTKAVQACETVLDYMQKNTQSYLSAADVVQVVEWQQALVFYKAEMQNIFARANVQNSAEAIALSQIPVPVTPPAKPQKGETSAPTVVIQLLNAVDANVMIAAGKDRLSGVFIKGVGAMEQAKLKETLALTGSIDQGFSRMAALFLSVSVVGIVLAIVLLMTMPALIIKPISRLSKSVDLLSKGDIDQEIESGNVTEFQPLAKGLERLRVAQSLLLQRLV